MQKGQKSGSIGKKPYVAPRVKKWGTVEDLTKTGLTQQGDDGKIGSISISIGLPGHGA